MSSRPKNSSLGIDPLTRNPVASGIFQKTDPESLSKSKNQEKRFQNTDSRIQNKESSFLADSDKEKVNMRLPLKLVDWLDELVKNGKRLHGQKIPKEIWIQAALELLRSAPIDWRTVDSVDSLKDILQSLKSEFHQS